MTTSNPNLTTGDRSAAASGRDDVRAATIEKCAKIAAEQPRQFVNGEATTVYGQGYQCACRDIEAAIRALSAPVAEGRDATSSDGSSRGLRFDPADAAGVNSGTERTFGQQEGRTGREVGALQTPGSSMSIGPDKLITAGQAPGPSEAIQNGGEP